MSILAILFCLASACSSNKNNIDPVLIPYYNKFISDSISVGIPIPYDEGISMKFGNLGQEDDDGIVVGECSKMGYGGGVITIDRVYWITKDYAYRITVVYHELGHCVLDRDHTSNPMSFMYPTVDEPANFYEYSENRLAMIKELFENMGL